MDHMDFEWFNKNKDNIDTPEVLDALVNQFSQNNSAANEISSASTGELIEYLLQGNHLESNYAPLNLMLPPSTAATTTTTTTVPNVNNNKASNNSATTTGTTGGSFFTFVTTSPNSTVPKKKETKETTANHEPIFVTESPQTMYNKQNNSSNNKKSTQHSSGEDGGSDDDMFEEIRSSPSYKMMTSKEKRQLRNKISARNFRVRRKEYITQLEEKVQSHEDTINRLKEENDKLRKANEELMQQLLNQSVTPPPSSNETSPPSSFSSGSPESIPGSTIPNAFQFPFDDLYEFNLFDIPAPLAPTTTTTTTNNNNNNITAPITDPLFINHLSVPTWNITKPLDDKQQESIFSSYEAIYDDARELIHQYPLLAPALMSIVLRHTLSLEYVQSYAKELQENEKMSSTTKTKKKNGIEYINHIEDTGKHPDELTDEEVSYYMLNHSFGRYVAYRMSGLSHQTILKRARNCLKGHTEEVRQKMQEKEGKKQECKKKKEEFELKKNTLYTYCQVAGKLLKNPNRMAHIGSVIKQTQTENYRRQHLDLPKQIGGNNGGITSLSSTLRNLRISKA